MTLKNFAKKFGFDRANNKDFRFALLCLTNSRAITIKQGGFIGDSMHHPKIVIIHDADAVNRHFSNNKPKLKVGKPRNYEYEAMEHFHKQYHTNNEKIKMLKEKKETQKTYKTYCIFNGRCEFRRIDSDFLHPICINPDRCNQKEDWGEFFSPNFKVQILKL